MPRSIKSTSQTPKKSPKRVAKAAPFVSMASPPRTPAEADKERADRYTAAVVAALNLPGGGHAKPATLVNTLARASYGWEDGPRGGRAILRGLERDLFVLSIAAPNLDESYLVRALMVARGRADAALELLEKEIEAHRAIGLLAMSDAAKNGGAS